MFFCPNCNSLFDISEIHQEDSDEVSEELDTSSVSSGAAENEDKENEDKKDKKDKKENININKNKKVKSSIASFKCNNCNYSKPIDPGTKLYTRLSDEDIAIYNKEDYSNQINNSTLPRTRNYVCPNTTCITQTKPDLKEAVFLRKNNTFQVVYICTLCKTSF